MNGILENAYHDLSGCDTNTQYSWFAGFITPISESNIKDTANTRFIIMYNNTTSSDEHELDNTQWHTVFAVDVNGMVEWYIMELNFKIENQRISQCDDNFIVQKSNKYLTLKFHFITDDWVDLNKFKRQ